MADTRMTLLELAERIEQAEPDIGSDLTLVNLEDEVKRVLWQHLHVSPRRFLHSLDDAADLVPDGLDWAVGHGIETEFGGSPSNYAWCGKGEGELIFAATPALALCAASLRARAQ